MLNTIDINGVTAYVGNEDAGVSLVASTAAMECCAAGTVLVQLTDMTSDNHRIRFADFLRHYNQPKDALDRFVVVNNYRHEITSGTMALRIAEATAQFGGRPKVVLLDLGNALLPTLPDFHMLAVLRDLPKQLRDTMVIEGICYGSSQHPPPTLTAYPANVIWQVSTFRTVMFTLKEITGDRVLRYMTKQAHGGLIVFEETPNE